MSYLGTKGELKKTREEKQIEWEIHDFTSLSKVKKFYYQSFPFTFANDSWHLSFFPEGDEGAEDGFMSLYLWKNTDLPCNVTFTLGIKRTDGKLTGERIFTHNFTKDSWGRPNFFQRLELLKQKSEVLPSDILTIVCSLKIGPGQTVTLKDPLLKLAESDTLSEDFRQLLANKKCFDTTLKVKDKYYDAHRTILVARSSVFAAMFEHDLTEKPTGVIVIADCDPDSFTDFLEYLYTGKAENITPGSAHHLYKTAEKYDVQKLKLFCVRYMMENLKVDHIVDVVVLADEYEEAELFSAAQDFFNENITNVFSTEKWQLLLKENHRLANKLLREMSLKVEVRRKIMKSELY